MTDAARTAVMLISFGGPERPEDIRPFLEIVLKGRPVPQDRLDAVVQHYMDIGGKSPLNELTRQQAAALQNELASRGASMQVVVGMRNWHPFLKDAIRKLMERGVTKIIGVILASHRGEASIDRYIASIEEARTALASETGSAVPGFTFVPAWYDQPLFIDALADRVKAGLAELPDDQRRDAKWLFTAHSVPKSMPGADTYVSDLNRTAELVGERFNHHPWRLVWQSRSGGPRDPWFEPDICDALREEAAAGVKAFLVVPIGFVCDHVEVLYDLDHQAAEVAGALHRTFARAPTVGLHPSFIRLLADLVLAQG